MPVSKNYSALRAVLALGGDRVDNMGKPSNAMTPEGHSGAPLYVGEAGNASPSVHPSDMRAKHIDDLADKLIGARKRRDVTTQGQHVTASAPALVEHYIAPLFGVPRKKPKSFMPFAVAMAAVLLCALVVPMWLLADRRAVVVAGADPYAMPSDAIATSYDGYYGEATKDPKDLEGKKLITKARRERVMLQTSTKSNLIRGTIGEGEKRFLITGAMSQSKDKSRDDLIITSVSQKVPETDADAPTIATYSLTRDPESGSYTGLANYWDDCNRTWIQCPYALEAVNDANRTDADNYATSRWPRTFSKQNECKRVISPPPEELNAKSKSSGPLLAITEEKKKSCPG